MRRWRSRPTSRVASMCSGTESPWWRRGVRSTQHRLPPGEVLEIELGLVSAPIHCTPGISCHDPVPPIRQQTRGPKPETTSESDPDWFAVPTPIHEGRVEPSVSYSLTPTPDGRQGWWHDTRTGASRPEALHFVLYRIGDPYPRFDLPLLRDVFGEEARYDGYVNNNTMTYLRPITGTVNCNTGFGTFRTTDGI